MSCHDARELREVPSSGPCFSQGVVELLPGVHFSVQNGLHRISDNSWNRPEPITFRGDRALPAGTRLDVVGVPWVFCGQSTS